MLEADGMSSITQIAKIKRLSSGTVSSECNEVTPQLVQLRLRLKLIYNISGEAKNLQQDINSIDGL